MAARRNRTLSTSGEAERSSRRKAQRVHVDQTTVSKPCRDRALLCREMPVDRHDFLGQRAARPGDPGRISAQGRALDVSPCISPQEIASPHRGFYLHFLLKSPAVIVESRLGSTCFRRAAFTTSGVSALNFLPGRPEISWSGRCKDHRRSRQPGPVIRVAALACCWRYPVLARSSSGR